MGAADDAGAAPTPVPGPVKERAGGDDPPVDQAAQTVRAWELAATVRGSHPAASAPLPDSHTPRIRARPSKQLPVAEVWAEHTSGDFTPSGAFPVPGWDRYQPIRLLGEGGMGRVFLARDLKLDRNVAIKFVRGDDLELVRRITAEARAQARVVDDRVCQVFDVGEIAGRIYIAMQAIEGRTLGEMARELTYEQKAMIIRGAALGVQEAHRVGLIHRDLKPSNIMVERSADGELRPYVMDFGVARDWTDDATATGTVLGTPQFMAPEQARGEVKQLDRRADIYSLGATLYTVLVDRPPIVGDNPLVVLNRIALDEPPRPRTIDHDVPADLEAIVMKCLEKERGARYDSARALADDLGRFLAGEPVLARGSVSLSHRVTRFVRRRWRLVALVGVMVALLGVALGFGLRERWRAARREELARRFTERVERIEALARTSALAPAHDIRNDRALIKAEMDAIGREMRTEGSVATAAGHYALGRGYLALGDDDHAEAELQTAWDDGFHDSRARYALALAKGNLYQRELNQLSPDERARQGEELHRRYRDPALMLLRVGGDAGAPAEHVAALIEFNEEHYDDALRHLDAIDLTAGGMASYFEAPLLRGRVLRARALRHDEHGEGAQAAADLEAGRRALAAAAAIAESDPSIQVAIGDLEHNAFVSELYGTGNVDEPFQRGVAAVGRAIAILPDDQPAWLLRAQFERELAVHRARRGLDVGGLLASALDDARKAVDLAHDPREQRLARYQLAEAYRSWGEAQQSQHEDPGPKLEESLKVALALDPADRKADDWDQLGLIYTHWADYQDEVGVDSHQHRDQAIEAYEHATGLNGQSAQAWLNLSKARYARAKQARGAEADRYLERALDALAQGARLAPDSVATLAYQAELRGLVADREEARGIDPAVDRDGALAAYRDALRLSPDEPVLHQKLSVEEVKAARAAWDRGRDPDPLLADARAAEDKAIAIAPEDPNNHNNLGDAWWQQAAYDRERGRDPLPAAKAARTEFERTLALLPGHPIILLNLAAVQVLVAEHELDGGGDPRPALAVARAALDQAAAQPHPRPWDLRLHGTAASIQARWLAARHQPADAVFEQAVASYRDALAEETKLEPDLPDVQEFGRDLARAELAWARARLAAGGDPARPIADGLEVVDGLLTARASWASPKALRGALVLVRAQASHDAAAAKADATAAAADLRDALAADPNLTWRHAADEAAARKLAAP
ncbi:MAG TPA: protein kinase [Kofleriaceae bacterium]|nr:protein kinase [Kofleriaceae bacterium]